MTNLLILAIPAAVAIVFLVIHAVHMRGTKTAALFFSCLFAFGILRGNLVYIITRGKTPYSFELPQTSSLPLFKIGYTGPVEALGWCIALYISWCLAERILSGRKTYGSNAFAILLFSCSMMMGFAIMMEAAAGRMDWWRWSPPRGLNFSPAFRDIERGITEWFSVGFDFLTGWLLFTSVKLRRRWLATLGLLPFPFHFGMHKIRRIYLGEHLIKVNHLSHFLMLAVAVLLPFFFDLEMKSVPVYSRAGKDRRSLWLARFDMVGLAIVVLTVIAGLYFVAEQAELVIFAMPLAFAGLYSLWWSEKGSPAAAAPPRIAKKRA